MTDEMLRIISRLAKTQEGKDFIGEVLKPKLVENHAHILSGPKETRDELVGFGNCLQVLVTLFENCDTKLTETHNTEPPEWL
jgi:hypothetical protein